MLNNKITYNDTKIFSVKIRVTFKLVQTSLFLVQKLGSRPFAVCFQIKLINRVGILTFQTSKYRLVFGYWFWTYDCCDSHLKQARYTPKMEYLPI